jgi:adenosylmethionine-8-amino-7-oxononanoate aminotransferase
MSLLRPNHQVLPPIISYGRGSTLYDISGKDYIDGSSGAMVANLGHGVEEIAEAAATQMRAVAYTYRTQFRNEPAETLAASLTRHSGDKKSAFFLSSGSEATEAAIRLAIQVWQEAGLGTKRRILSRRISYHGNTLGALSISADSRRQAISGLSVETTLVPACYPYRCTAAGDCDGSCICHLEDTIELVGAANIAAFVLEPVIGASGGAIVPHGSYLQQVRDICNRHDILLIFDEVITGLGRTGKWFAAHHWNVSSDITILGKGLNAGFTPLSALLLSERVTKVIEQGSGRVSFGHTHSGNPASTAICNAVINYIERNNLVARAESLGPHLFERLLDVTRRHAFVGDVRGIGMLWGIEFVSDPETKRPFHRGFGITDRVVASAAANGLIVYPCRGLHGSRDISAVLIAPPLTITALEIDALFDRLSKTLDDVANQLPSNSNAKEEPAHEAALV